MKTVEVIRRQEFYNNGQIASEDFRLTNSHPLINGGCHNSNGPAHREWYTSGQLACEWHYIEGKYHRIDAPAAQEWYLNGRPMRVGHWRHGVLHNENGPAFQEWDMNGTVCKAEYWINGVEMPEEEFRKYLIGAGRIPKISDWCWWMVCE